MKATNLFFILFAFAMIIFSSSCKKDEIQPDEVVQPSISNKSQMAEKPAGLENSDDANAQTCAGYFDMINGISEYFTSFEVPDNAELVKTKSTGSWCWTWSAEGITVWMTWTETASKYSWEYDVDYLGSGRVTYLYAEEDKDGMHGLLDVYGTYLGNGTEVFYTYTWDYDDSGACHFVCDYISGTFKIDANINADGSGDFSYYFGETLWYYVVWNIDGSGTWTYYFGETISGSWTA